MGISIMVTSGKGGTGKTSLTAGVAGCLAALGKRVLCIDMDIGLRSLDLVLGLEDRAVMDFTDVMDRRCTLLDAAAAQPGIPGLYLLTAPVGLDEPDFPRFRATVQEAKDLFDFVFLDSPAGLGHGFRLAMAGADRAIVVSAADPAALRNAQRAVTELSAQELSPLHLVMNRVEPRLIRRMHTTLDDAMDTAGLPLLGVVPEDRQVILAAARRQPLVLYSHKGAVRAYLNIAKRLLGEEIPLGSR